MKINDEKLLELLREVAEDHHMEADDHDDENFRGCTHPGCRMARLLIKMAKEMLESSKGED